jgi:adenylate cyclase
VGRAGRRENQILINDRTVSREHAVLTADAQGYRLRVEASSAPTYLNGNPVEGEAALKDGDLLQFGNQLVRLQIGSASARASSMQTLPATVLYADVSNCEKLLAERPMDEMVRQMADYYEMVDRVVSEGSGRLTTYLGDAAVALFDDEAAAVQAALTLCRHIDQMNDLWRQVGQAEFEIGIGLHTGDIVVGDLSLGARSDFAAVGEQADLAAQIERQTRRKKERILLSATTAQGVGQRLALRSLGTSQINGTSLELFAPA